MRTTIVSALMLALSLAAESGAATEVLTFDDLTGSDAGGVPVPNGYGSLSWDFIYWLNSSTVSQTPNGYLNGLVSGTNVAYGGSPGTGSISAATPFSVISMYMTAAWDDPVNIEIVGFRSNTVIYDNTFIVRFSGPTLLALNYLNVDRVEFHPLSGTQINPNIASLQFAIDNLTVTVPEPALPALAAFGVLALALRRRRSEHPLLLHKGR